MTGMLELLDRKFKTIRINMLKALIYPDKRDNMQEQMDNINRDGNSKKELKRNDRDKTKQNEKKQKTTLQKK